MHAFTRRFQSASGRRFSIALSLVLTAACGEPVDYVAWPSFGPEIQTVVLALEKTGTGPILSAHASTELPEIELDEAARLLVLGYAAPLARFGDGVLTPGAAEPGCLLPFPESVLRFSTGDAAFLESELSADEADPLDGDLNCLGCLRFREQRAALGGPDASLALRLPSGAAVVRIEQATTGAHQLLRVARDGQTAPLSGCEGHRYTAAAEDAPRNFWLGAERGLLEHVSIDEDALRCTVLLSTRAPSRAELPPGNVTSLALIDTGTSLELVVATSEGRLERFEPQSGWTALGFLPPDPGDAVSDTTVALLDADQIVMSGGGDDLLLWDRDLGPERRHIELGAPVDPFRPPWITTLGRDEGGFLIGDSEGRVSRWREPGQLERIPVPTELGDVGLVARRNRGLVALGEGGRVMQVNDAGQACEFVHTIEGSFRSVPRTAFIEADGTMFVSDSIKAGGDALGVWLRPD